MNFPDMDISKLMVSFAIFNQNKVHNPMVNTFQAQYILFAIYFNVKNLKERAVITLFKIIQSGLERSRQTIMCCAKND